MTNRLDEEESPYLQQHADNPVDWQPWDDEALEEAEERDVPIFLSVGYSACHWCHVMEEESFEDEGTARLLNEGFVPIKVDREERPDIDRVYQLACQLTSGQGGWPLSAFLTPDGRPFHVGTYYPDEPRRGMPSFTQVLERVVERWEDDRDGIEKAADRLSRRVRTADEPDTSPEEPDDDILTVAAGAAVDEADRDDGGFGRSPKFPQPSRVDVLLRAYERTDRDVFRDIAVETLDAWIDRGLHDHVGGGFHRYCVDADWTVPHFEKMLYDNAEIPRMLLDGYRVTGDARYARAARRTFDFLEREMRSPEGGFYSTLSAQSDGEEGAFYVWTPDGIRETLDDDAELVIDRFGVTDEGNFEGSNVLTVSRDVEALADAYDDTPDGIRERLDTALDRLLEGRERRPRPDRDEKVLASWNGLAVSALAHGGYVLDGGGRYTSLAEDALGFVRETLWDADERRLSRRYRNGEVAVDGYLDDYAFVARGALDLFGATGEPEHLTFALELGRVVVEGFHEDGALYYTAGDDLVSRPRETQDTSTPSSVGVAADVLVALSSFDDSFEEPAREAVEANVADAERRPLGHESVVLAADRLNSPLEIVPVGDHAAWRDELAETYAPGALVAPRPPTDEGLEGWFDGASEAPVWRGREATEDADPTGYVCRSFTWSPPTTPDGLAGWLDDLSP